MHYFYDFKGFANAELDLFKPFTILIGPNGSGKSNVIEGIELLSFIAHGRPLHKITDVGRGAGGMEVRGGLQACPRHGQVTSFSLGFNAMIEFEGKNSKFSYLMKVEPQPRIIEESLMFNHNTLIFQSTGPQQDFTSGDIKVEYSNFAPGPNSNISVESNHSVLSQYKNFAVRNKKYDACVSLVNGIMNYLRSSFVFDPHPNLMRAYERIGNNILSRDGANLSAVLFALDQGNTEEKETLNRLLGWIKQLPEEPYRAFRFFTTPLNDVIFGLQEGDDEDRIVDARLLSDGTLRSLAVLTALETVEPHSRVIIEEFDNGLHPSRVHILSQAIESCCRRRNLNVLVTTHNPATLDALQPEQLDGVVLCAWDNAQQTFKLVRLYDLPRCDELLEQGRLGDLVTRRVVEQYLAPNFEEERKAGALAWLEDLP